MMKEKPFTDCSIRPKKPIWNNEPDDNLTEVAIFIGSLIAVTAFFVIFFAIFK